MLLKISQKLKCRVCHKDLYISSILSILYNGDLTVILAEIYENLTTFYIYLPIAFYVAWFLWALECENISGQIYIVFGICLLYMETFRDFIWLVCCGNSLFYGHLIVNRFFWYRWRQLFLPLHHRNSVWLPSHCHHHHQICVKPNLIISNNGGLLAFCAYQLAPSPVTFFARSILLVKS